jgi:hypothetical protein
MQFEIFRLSVVPQIRPPIIEYIDQTRPKKTRSEFLENAFENSYKFQHRRSTLVYKFDIRDHHHVLAMIGRQIEKTGYGPPESSFQPIKIDWWARSHVVFDLSAETTGQKVAVLRQGEVGEPFTVLKSLIDHINKKNKDEDWKIEFEPMASKSNFWKIYLEKQKSITQVKFDLVVPNILGAHGELTEFAKQVWDQEHAQKFTLGLSADPGQLQLKTERLEAAVTYSHSGGGRATLKAKGKIVYDSHKEIVTREMKDFPHTPIDTDVSRRNFLRLLIPHLLRDE